MAKDTPGKRKTREKQEKFLQAFAATGTILSGCLTAGVSRSRVYEWRKDPVFDAKFLEADAGITEKLEYNALKQAMGGDTVMTIFLLKARNPKVYHDRYRLEHSGPDGVPLIPPPPPPDLSGMTKQQLLRLVEVTDEPKPEV